MTLQDSDIFEDINLPHPENFSPDENYTLVTLRKMTVEELAELGRLQKRLQLKERVGNIICGPIGVISMFIIAMSGIFFLTF